MGYLSKWGKKKALKYLEYLMGHVCRYGSWALFAFDNNDLEQLFHILKKWRVTTFSHGLWTEWETALSPDNTLNSMYIIFLRGWSPLVWCLFFCLFWLIQGPTFTLNHQNECNVPLNEFLGPNMHIISQSVISSF